MALQLIIIQIVTFVSLIFVLRMLFYRQLNSSLLRLQSLHQENLKKEAVLKQELEVIQKQRDEELSKAREEAVHIIKDAKNKAERMSGDINAQANVQAQHVIEEAKLKLQVLENDLKSKYEQGALHLAGQIFETVFTAKGKESLQHMLVEELIEEIRGLPVDKFTVKVSGGAVISAYNLNDQQRKTIQEIISQKTNESVVLNEQIDQSIICGLIIQLGPLTLDGSLRNKLNKTVAYLTSKHSAI